MQALILNPPLVGSTGARWGSFGRPRGSGRCLILEGGRERRKPWAIAALSTNSLGTFLWREVSHARAANLAQHRKDNQASSENLHLDGECDPEIEHPSDEYRAERCTEDADG